LRNTKERKKEEEEIDFWPNKLKLRTQKRKEELKFLIKILIFQH